ncbi:restriction endonuclease [Flammeovirga pectinis]|uniref:Restriction endonuclease n=1 Tax=Flammeovirga pectinis TaxID=2494373 RepID=A0A3Q9FKE9_9BACT|nr:restriction endonuclease [Flammeovirga pectinis]AZQ61727.1 restriction endonuclease [Flammeovirga pectinis]
MKKVRFTLFEHETLKVGQEKDSVVFTMQHLQALEKFYGDECPYFSLINKGIKCNEHVGVIHVGNIIIEVLPKADRSNSENKWRELLIRMLKMVSSFNVSAPTSSFLSLQSNYILDLYFELYLKEIDLLLHKGLIKKYRRVDNNQKALKGRLQLSKHLQKNIIHKERFYVNHTVYDQEHQIHQILLQALKCIELLNTNPKLNVTSVIFRFPELSDIHVSKYTFEKLNLGRKFKHYETALSIAKLILLNFHPDLSNGQSDVLALMFNMNNLWEKFVFFSLRQRLKNCTVKEQGSKLFWEGGSSHQSFMKPDIIIEKPIDEGIKTFVLDTKWKNLYGGSPSAQDLRQLYVYHQFYDAEKVALVYPGEKDTIEGQFQKEGRECAVIQISYNDNLETFIDNIVEDIEGWL